MGPTLSREPRSSATRAAARTPGTASTAVQFIKEERRSPTSSYAQSRYVFLAEVLKCMLQPVGRNPVVVVAVFGQSGIGKSTMLNTLFGTDYQVLNDKEEASGPTTKGLWAALVKPAHAPGQYFLVIDVEGSDGIDKATDTAFEQRSAVLVAHSADIIMYHVPESAIGKFSGAGIQLLRTVFREILTFNLRERDTMWRQPVLLTLLRDGDFRRGVNADLKRAGWRKQEQTAWRHALNIVDDMYKGAKLENHFELRCERVHDRRYNIGDYEKDCDRIMRYVRETVRGTGSKADVVLKSISETWSIIQKDPSFDVGYLSDELAEYHVEILLQRIMEKMTEQVKDAAFESIWGRVSHTQRFKIRTQAEADFHSAIKVYKRSAAITAKERGLEKHLDDACKHYGRTEARYDAVVDMVGFAGMLADNFAAILFPPAAPMLRGAGFLAAPLLMFSKSDMVKESADRFYRQTNTIYGLLSFRGSGFRKLQQLPYIRNVFMRSQDRPAQGVNAAAAASSDHLN